MENSRREGSIRRCNMKDYQSMVGYEKVHNISEFKLQKT